MSAMNTKSKTSLHKEINTDNIQKRVNFQRQKISQNISNLSGGIVSGNMRMHSGYIQQAYELRSKKMNDKTLASLNLQNKQAILQQSAKPQKNNKLATLNNVRSKPTRQEVQKSIKDRTSLLEHQQNVGAQPQQYYPYQSYAQKQFSNKQNPEQTN